MRSIHKYKVAAGLAILAIACVAGAFLTRDSPGEPSAAKQTNGSTRSPIDERLAATANRLAALADTAEEQALAHEALRLSDHELDQAFASALRETAAIVVPKQGPFKQLSDHIAQLKAKMAKDEARIAKLTKQATADESVAGQVELAKAQLALDQDELEDAREDLARQGGDQHATLQRLIQEHESAVHAAAAQSKTTEAGNTATLGGEVTRWLALRNRRQQLEAAYQEASGKGTALSRVHDTLEKLIRKDPVPAEISDDEDTAPMVDRLRHLSDQVKTLAELDKRIQDTQQLAAVYKRWGAITETGQRSMLHSILLSLAAILAILLIVVVIDRSIRLTFSHRTDRKRLHHLRVMATIAVQLIGALLILLIVFGPPTQISTVIGLATAGLTVVLKDFIVAFFGWFALMGKNGIRVGDWVEIEGIGGEVIEIGVLKTVLLETGNWGGSGHPTGRRVSFVNKFAIENHYFNFSTAGRWLWDELRMTLPATGDPYHLALRIRERVEQETDADTRAAEQDWERVTSQYGAREFSAKPAVDLRPSVNGLEVIVRYITHAPQRHEVKSRLFKAIVDLVHKPAA